MLSLGYFHTMCGDEVLGGFIYYVLQLFVQYQE